MKLSENVEIVAHPHNSADHVYNKLKSGNITKVNYSIFDDVEVWWMVFINGCSIKISLDIHGLHCLFDINECTFDISLISDICKEFKKWQYNKILEVMTKDYVNYSVYELLPRIQNVVSKYDNQPSLSTSTWHDIFNKH